MSPTLSLFCSFHLFFLIFLFINTYIYIASRINQSTVNILDSIVHAVSASST
ncbi:hypothetical protein BCR43DRAFT_498289 [Syncephalastrum racemosum]|uniref:Uncharacterized protein n=1 Tax=Syncephalastrum racemosum TaxID=13706 RepID=A0A1X2H0N4_SYNRA|nr:hypothetical protein BCR43DRAFT_498289 [Syncephalastrum racemosum]